MITAQAGAQIYSQLYTGRQEMFLEAEAFHLFQEYNEALPLYLELLKEDPDNAFLSYRAGSCYLNIPGEKERSIEYLEKAVTAIDSRDRRPTFRTREAPLDAIFLLGQAYHINYQFEKALEMFNDFREKLNPSVYNAEIVDEHIQATKNAMVSVKNPVFFLEENLGERINTRFSETNPVVSGDKSVLVFTRELPFYDGVFFSVKDEEGEWSWPMEITPQIGSDGDCYPVALSYDGKELYFYKSDDYVGNIYVSNYANDRWSPIRKLNENINTRYWESHASISKDGSTLYFTSNRPGGYGGLDIYYSERKPGGNWGPAVNLGPDINTPYNEDTPFITEDNSTLYFSSLGHHNIGGYDVFYSARLEDGSWSIPVNAGYGISTPDDDLFFNPVKNGIYAFVAKFDDEGFGGTDIYMYEIFSETHPRKFQLTGIMGRKDGLQTGPGARISIADRKTGEIVRSVRPHQITGEYEIEIEAGEWDLIFSEDGHELLTQPLILPTEHPESEITVDALLERTEPEIPGIEQVITDSIIIPEYLLPPATLGIEQHQYDITDEERVRIGMRLERGTLLEVEKYLDGELIGKDTLTVQRRRFNYDYDPLPGENILRFIYTDRDGNVITEEVVINYDPPVLIDDRLLEKISLEAERQQLIHDTPDDFIISIMPQASDELRTFLEYLQAEDKVPGTIEELLRMITESAEEYGYDPGEVFGIMAMPAPETLYPEPAEFIRAIMPYASDQLREYLEYLQQNNLV
ncbi:MAG: hypothetical protein EA408_00685, partial [Marinilabiliales bacterium]